MDYRGELELDTEQCMLPCRRKCDPEAVGLELTSLALNAAFRDGEFEPSEYLSVYSEVVCAGPKPDAPQADNCQAELEMQVMRPDGTTCNMSLSRRSPQTDI